MAHAHWMLIVFRVLLIIWWMSCASSVTAAEQKKDPLGVVVGLGRGIQATLFIMLSWLL